MSMAQLIPETYFTVQEQIALFGGASLLGIPLGFLQDFLHVLLKRRKLPAAVTALQDLLLCLFAAALLLLYSSAFARGQFRVYYAAACLVGFVLYECTIGRLVKHLFAALLGFLTLPCSICRKLSVCFVGNSQKSQNAQKSDKNLLQDGGQMVYNNKMSKESAQKEKQPAKKRS